ncbi:MAG: response regulator [Candidatus Margulisiibacteriota bacterium]
MAKYRILMVDDETNYPTAFKFLTELKGDYEVLVAASGKEAFEIARSSRPDVITLDVMLGGEDGVDILKKIREENSLKDIPVIMMSGVEAESSRQAAEALGIEDFLTKPVEMDDLLRKINLIKARDSISQK